MNPATNQIEIIGGGGGGRGDPETNENVSDPPNCIFCIREVEKKTKKNYAFISSFLKFYRNCTFLTYSNIKTKNDANYVCTNCNLRFVVKNKYNEKYNLRNCSFSLFNYIF